MCSTVVPTLYKGSSLTTLVTRQAVFAEISTSQRTDALLYKPLPSAPEESFDHGTVPQIWRTQLVSAPRNNPEKVISQTKKDLKQGLTHNTSPGVWPSRTHAHNHTTRTGIAQIMDS